MNCYCYALKFQNLNPPSSYKNISLNNCVIFSLSNYPVLIFCRYAIYVVQKVIWFYIAIIFKSTGLTSWHLMILYLVLS